MADNLRRNFMDTQQPTESKKKSSLPPIVMVGIGCLVILVILGIGLSLAARFLMKRVGVGLIQSAIESKTGVKTNLQDIQNGKMTFTDNKTGQTVDIGTGKLPDNFPSDFPQYPGAKVTGTLSGGKAGGANNGFWVTFSTPDSFEKVSSFYTTALKTNGWTTTSSFNAGSVTTLAIEKGNMDGSIAISTDTQKKETTMVVTLGEKAKSEDTSTPEETPNTEAPNTGVGY